MQISEKVGRTFPTLLTAASRFSSRRNRKNNVQRRLRLFFEYSKIVLSQRSVLISAGQKDIAFGLCA